MARNIVITGGNDGIGREMARALAGDGDRVIIASRDLERSNTVVESIRGQTEDADIQAMALDLGDFESVDRFAASVLDQWSVVDVLILNAGLYTRRGKPLDNGFEAMMGVMHFGHFRLAERLKNAVIAAQEGRIVVTSSTLHKHGRLREASFTDPHRLPTKLAGYAQAKLANLLFTRELARQLADTGVTVNAFHPGMVRTGIYQELPRLVQWPLKYVLITPERGADTGVWLARASAARQYSGEYFVRREVAASSAASKDAEQARWLWRYSAANAL